MTKTEYIYNNNNTPPQRKSPFISRTSSFRRLRQYQQQCSYCGMTGHIQANCLLHDIDIHLIKHSCENNNMRTQLVTELIPKKYWVQNCDPVKLFLNNNNIHNYRTQQLWKKKNN